MSTISVPCFQCGKYFEQDVKYQNENEKLNQNNYCSRRCVGAGKKVTRLQISCSQCSKPLETTERLFKKSKTKRFFCNSSCAGTYHNTHKTKGIRRSKLEKFIEENLPTDFPSLTFKFNEIETVGMELDIFCTDLNLAIEVNGACHYKPIFGQEAFMKTTKADVKKKRLCEENGVNLFVLDASKHSYVNTKTCEKYYSIVKTQIKNGQGTEI